MMGLVDTVSTNVDANSTDYAVNVNGRDLSKLLVEDGSYFIPLKFVEGSPDRWFYGLGLVPFCPCTQNGDYIESSRFGLDSATGSFAVDRTGAVVVLRPSNWFRGPEPIREFLTLEGQLLDAATTR